MRQSLRNVHFAILESDTNEGASYKTGKPETLIGAISASVEPATESVTQFADDGPHDVATNLGEIAVELALAELSLKNQATLLGHTYKNGVIIKNSADEAPFVALGFMSEVNAGVYELTWLYKGKFALVSSEYGTKTNTPAFREPSISAIFVRRVFDGNWQAVANSGDDGFVPALATGWFAKVQEPIDLIPVP